MDRLSQPDCTDRVVRESIGYSAYMTILLKACAAVIDPEGRFFGTQAGRKTFYYMGTLGGADAQRLMRNARHATVESAERYIASAGELIFLSNTRDFDREFESERYSSQ
jgi:hypothetical protein